MALIGSIPRRCVNLPPGSLQTLIGCVIGNKVQCSADEALLKERMAAFDFAGFVPYDESIRSADLDGKSISHASPAVKEAVNKIIQVLSQ